MTRRSEACNISFNKKNASLEKQKYNKKYAELVRKQITYKEAKEILIEK